MPPDRPTGLSEGERFPAIRTVLAAYRSTEAHITEAQITAAWAEFDSLAAAPPVSVEGGDDQELTAEGCTIEEAAIGKAAVPVAAKHSERRGVGPFDRWTLEEGWRLGREYERSRLAASPSSPTGKDKG